MLAKALPSPSEWRVFACLREGPLTLRQLEQLLPDLERFTIETLLLRLADKGYVSPRDTSTSSFRALVSHQEALQQQIDRFLEIIIRGDREACAQLLRSAEEHYQDLEP